jgi:hypothetical protein
MIGDTPYDAEAGIEAGTKVAGVLTGGFAEKVLDQAGCFAVGRDLPALLPSLLFGEGGPGPGQTDWLRSAYQSPAAHVIGTGASSEEW